MAIFDLHDVRDWWANQRGGTSFIFYKKLLLIFICVWWYDAVRWNAKKPLNWILLYSMYEYWNEYKKKKKF